MRACDSRGAIQVRLLLIGQAIALVLFTLIIPIEVIYAKESLGTSDAGFGILLASWGAGIVVGSLVYLLVKQRSALGLIVISTALIGFACSNGMATTNTLLGRMPHLGRRRSRQRRPVDLGRHVVAGDDADRLPGADRRPARVDRRRDARLRIPDRRHAGRRRLAAYGVRGSRHRRSRAGSRRVGRAAGLAGSRRHGVAPGDLPVPESLSPAPTFEPTAAKQDEGNARIPSTPHAT